MDDEVFPISILIILLTEVREAEIGEIYFYVRHCLGLICEPKVGLIYSYPMNGLVRPNDILEFTGLVSCHSITNLQSLNS